MDILFTTYINWWVLKHQQNDHGCCWWMNIILKLNGSKRVSISIYYLTCLVIVFQFYRLLMYPENCRKHRFDSSKPVLRDKVGLLHNLLVNKPFIPDNSWLLGSFLCHYNSYVEPGDDESRPLKKTNVRQLEALRDRVLLEWARTNVY